MITCKNPIKTMSVNPTKKKGMFQGPFKPPTLKLISSIIITDRELTSLQNDMILLARIFSQRLLESSKYLEVKTCTTLTNDFLSKTSTDFGGPPIRDPLSSLYPTPSSHLPFCSLSFFVGSKEDGPLFVRPSKL